MQLCRHQGPTCAGCPEPMAVQLKSHVAACCVCGMLGLWDRVLVYARVQSNPSAGAAVLFFACRTNKYPREVPFLPWYR